MRRRGQDRADVGPGAEVSDAQTLVVDDIGRGVDDLNAAGVVTKIYTEPTDFGTDERGIAWSSEQNPGPNIAWFRDPAGNVLSLIEA